MYHHLCICVFLSFILKALKKKLQRPGFMQSGGSNREEGSLIYEEKNKNRCTVIGLLCEREYYMLFDLPLNCFFAVHHEYEDQR